MSAGITVIVNESSGAAGQGAALEDAVAREGLNVQIVRVAGPEILEAADRAAAAGHVLVAAGGDGTVSSVASVAARTGSMFGVIPLGTLNHFARDAGIPLDLDKAVATIAAGHTRTLDVADMNGRMFLNNASLGLYPRLVWEREAAESRGRGKWIAFAIALLRTWRRYPTVAVRMMVDGAALVRRTPFIFIGNGEYRAEGLGIGTRASLSGGRLSVYLAPECGRFEILALPLRALAGRLTADVKFESSYASEISIDTNWPSIPIALDGELATARPPIHFGIRPRALRTIVPDPK